MGAHPAQGGTQTHQGTVRHLNRRNLPPKCPSEQNNHQSSNDRLSQTPQTGHLEPYRHVYSQVQSGWSKADRNPAVTPLQVLTARQGPCDASGLALVPVHSRCELALISQYMLGPGDLSGHQDLFRAPLPREQCVLFLLSPRAALPSLFQLACVLHKHHVSQQICRTHTAWWAFEPLCLASGCFLYLLHFPVPGTMGKEGNARRPGRGLVREPVQRWSAAAQLSAVSIAAQRFWQSFLHGSDLRGFGGVCSWG